MTVSDAERAQHTQALTELILHLARQFAADRALGTENADVILRAALNAAFSVAQERGLDRHTATTLIICTTEGIAHGR